MFSLSAMLLCFLRFGAFVILGFDVALGCRFASKYV